jgi:hypothetical protein
LGIFQHKLAVSLPLASFIAVVLPHEVAVEWVDQMIGHYNTEEHQGYVSIVDPQGCGNLVARNLRIALQPQMDPALGPLLRLRRGRRGHIATPSILAAGCLSLGQLWEILFHCHALVISKVEFPKEAEQGFNH